MHLQMVESFADHGAHWAWSSVEQADKLQTYPADACCSAAFSKSCTVSPLPFLAVRLAGGLACAQAASYQLCAQCKAYKCSSFSPDAAQICYSIMRVQQHTPKREIQKSSR